MFHSKVSENILFDKIEMGREGVGGLVLEVLLCLDHAVFDGQEF